jgi:hypothetical protein
MAFISAQAKSGRLPSIVSAGRKPEEFPRIFFQSYLIIKLTLCRLSSSTFAIDTDPASFIHL